MILAIVRCSLRCVRISMHFAAGILKIQVLKRQHGEQWYAIKLGRKAIRQWMIEACRIIGLKIHVSGTVPAEHGQLYVANHVSWLDIIAIASVTDCKFLSKDTVRHWPLIGWLTVSVGSLFIRRNSRRAFHKSLQRVQQRLELGESVCIFPEGTTSDGQRILPFHSGLLQAAIDAEVAVQPLLLQYQDKSGRYEQHAPYYGRDVFVVHVLRLLCKPVTHLQLTVKPAMPQKAGADRQKLANVLQQRYASEVQAELDKAGPLVLEVR